MINASVRIAAPPEVVFPYFTDPKLMVTWMGDSVDLDARPGGTFAVDFGAAVAPGSYVSRRRNAGGKGPAAGTVRAEPRRSPAQRRRKENVLQFFVRGLDLAGTAATTRG